MFELISPFDTNTPPGRLVVVLEASRRSVYAGLSKEVCLYAFADGLTLSERSFSPEDNQFTVVPSGRFSD